MIDAAQDLLLLGVEGKAIQLGHDGLARGIAERRVGNERSKEFDLGGIEIEGAIRDVHQVDLRGGAQARALGDRRQRFLLSLVEAEPGRCVDLRNGGRIARRRRN